VNLTFLDQLPPWLASLGRAVFILAVAYIGTQIARRVARSARESAVAIMLRRAEGSRTELEKRANTIIGIVQTTAITLMWSVAVVMALQEAGFDVTPIIAGAGVVGLAVGFGAQNLVRDVISGFFILIENQIRVNDVAIVNGTSGLVEEINLRTTVLRSQDGVVHVFPNGAITSLSNMTREYSYYVLDISVAYKEDSDRVVNALRGVADELRADREFGPQMIEPLEVLGLDRFTDTAMVVRARIKTLPMQQWDVGRELNRRIKKRLDELGIDVPARQKTAAVRVQLEPPDSNELRRMVREIVEELRARPE
jgi:small-conductance mechanosensitive channel